MTEPRQPASSLRARAPGKLMLFGEYAVLDGAPALVTAVDRHVELSQWCEPPDQTRPTLDYRVGDEALSIGLTERDDTTGLLLAAAEPMGRLPVAVIDAIAQQAPQQLSGLHVRVIVEAMTERLSARKLGLGSSAASCVVLTGALGHFLGAPLTIDDIFPAAFRAHRDFQAGRGSGADVAAAAYGGLIEYRLESWDEPVVEPLAASKLPPWRAIWIGQSADTRMFIAAMEALGEREPERLARVIDGMAEIAREACHAVRAGDHDTLLGCVHEAELRADRLGVAAGVPIITDAHRELSRRARNAGLFTKVSGAGGGDLSLVFGADPEALDAFTSSLAGTGLTPVALHTSPAGFEITSGAR